MLDSQPRARHKGHELLQRGDQEGRWPGSPCLGTYNLLGLLVVVAFSLPRTALSKVDSFKSRVRFKHTALDLGKPLPTRQNKSPEMLVPKILVYSESWANALIQEAQGRLSAG